MRPAFTDAVGASLAHLQAGRVAEAAHQLGTVPHPDSNPWVAFLAHELANLALAVPHLPDTDHPLAVHLQYLVRLAQAVLALQTGGPLNQTEIELPQWQHDLLQAWAPAAANRQLELYTLPHPGLPRRLTVATLVLDVAAHNLVANALKYTVSGAIELRLSASEHTLQLAVADTGMGLNDRASIQHDARWAPSHGLGLQLVRELVQRAGGHLRLEPGANLGVVATVELPYQPVATAVPELSVHLPLQGRVAWVVCEKAGLAESVLTSLRALGAEATGWLQPRQALHEVSTGAQPDILLLDLDTPFTRPQHWLPLLPEGVLWGFGWNASPAMPFIQKPVSVSRLVKALQLAPEQEAATPAVLQHPATLEQPVEYLVADDSPFATRAVTLLADQLGVAGIAVTDGLQALQAAYNQPLRLALLDLDVPPFGAIGLARRLRQLRPRLRMVVLTAQPEWVQQQLPPAERRLFHNWYTKPLTLNQLQQELLLAAPLEPRLATEAASAAEPSPMYGATYGVAVHWLPQVQELWQALGQVGQSLNVLNAEQLLRRWLSAAHHRQDARTEQALSQWLRWLWAGEVETLRQMVQLALKKMG
jgi:CheY-like chemotaxis protein